MVTKQRWQEAQTYEQSYWANLAEQIASGSQGQLDWYAWKAKLMEGRLEKHLSAGGRSHARILEIGSGPIGIVTFLDWGQRYTLDPLEKFYAANATLSKLRNPAVTYGIGSGEQIPFDSNSFDVVILDNVLDHVHQAPQVLDEIQRVLKSSGLFYIAVNVHTNWGAFLHRILSRLKIDRGHPYTFTPLSIREFLEVRKFSVVQEFVNSYEEARLEDLRSSSLKARIKAQTGLSEFVYFAVCLREQAR